MNKMRLILLLISSFLVVHCNTESKEKDIIDLDLLGQIHFNSIQIGDSLHVIQEVMSSDPIVTMEGVLCSDTIDSQWINYRDAYFSIDAGKAFEITIDYHLTHDSIVPRFFKECKAKLDEVYGLSDMDDGYAAWSAPSIHDKVIEIELFDESIDHKIPMVSINFYEDFDKSFYAE